MRMVGYLGSSLLVLGLALGLVGHRSPCTARAVCARDSSGPRCGRILVVAAVRIFLFIVGLGRAAAVWRQAEQSAGGSHQRKERNRTSCGIGDTRYVVLGYLCGKSTPRR